VITVPADAHRERVRLARLRVEGLLDRCGWRWDPLASRILDELIVLEEEGETTR
jgi:hypothetical protein